MKTYHILTGLRRSGSTVLASILNQHPEIFVTPTSPMIELILSMKQICETNLTVKASFDEDQVDRIIKSISYSCWQHRPESIIIDKNRKWTEILLNSNSFETIFDNDTKVIYTDRDLPSIVASWASILKKNSKKSITLFVKVKIDRLCIERFLEGFFKIFTRSKESTSRKQDKTRSTGVIHTL